MKDFLAVSDLSPAEVQNLLDLAIRLKEEYFERGNPPLLKGKVLGMIFQKPSLRTRVSFDMAMRHLGGDALYLSPNEIGLGQRESIADVARVLALKPEDRVMILSPIVRGRKGEYRKELEDARRRGKDVPNRGCVRRHKLLRSSIGPVKDHGIRLGNQQLDVVWLESVSRGPEIEVEVSDGLIDLTIRV